MRKSAVWEPGADGVNATVIVQTCACGTLRWHGGCAAGWTAWPPLRAASRRAGVRTEKSCRLDPLMLIRVIVAGELPLLVMVKDLVMLVLTWAAGKTRADGWKDTPEGWKDTPEDLPAGPLCPRLSSAAATLTAATTTAVATAMAALGRTGRDVFLGAACCCLFRLPVRTSACFAPCPPDSWRPVWGS